MTNPEKNPVLNADQIASERKIERDLPKGNRRVANNVERDNVPKADRVAMDSGRKATCAVMAASVVTINVATGTSVATTDHVQMANRVAMDSVRKVTCAVMAVSEMTPVRAATISAVMVGMPAVTTDRVRMDHRVAMDSGRKATCVVMAVSEMTPIRAATISAAMVEMPAATTDRVRMAHRVVMDHAAMGHPDRKRNTFAVSFSQEQSISFQGSESHVYSQGHVDRDAARRDGRQQRGLDASGGGSSEGRAAS